MPRTEVMTPWAQAGAVDTIVAVAFATAEEEIRLTVSEQEILFAKLRPCLTEWLREVMQARSDAQRNRIADATG
jgi:hypothetical protein